MDGYGTSMIDVLAPIDTPQAFSAEDPTTDLTQVMAMWGATADTVSGEHINPHRALGIAAVWQAITIISGDIAKLPVHLYRRDEENGRQRLRSHPAAKLVRKRPNPLMNVFKFWQRVMTYRLLYNNAYIWIQRDRMGNAINLWPLLPDRTWVHDWEGYGTYYHTQLGHDTLTLMPTEVIHLEGLCIDNVQGEYFVRCARDAFGLALARQNYAARFFRRGGRFGGLLEMPAEMKKESRDTAEAKFRAQYESADNAFRAIAMRAGMKYHPNSHSPEQAQMVESDRASVRDVARYFNLNPSKLGEDAKSSYNSKAEDNRDHHDTTLSPHLNQIVEELAFKLLTASEFEDDELYFEHNTDRLLQLDPLKRAQQYRLLRQAEVLSPNEARARENMPPYEGGDDYGNPNTKPANASPAPAEGEGNGNDQANAAHRRLLVDTIDRTLGIAADKLNKQAKKPGFATWCETRLASVLLPVVEAVAPIIDAHAAISGVDSHHLKLAVQARLFAAVTTLIDSNQVADGLNSYHKVAGHELAAIAIPGGLTNASQSQQETSLSV